MADIGIRVLVLGVAEARRGISTVQSDVTGLEKTMRGLSGTSTTVGQTLTSVGSAISGLGRTLTLTVTGPLAALGGALINAGIQFEDAFAGVTKTVDGLATPMGVLTQAGEDLRDKFVELSTTIPVSPNQLAALGQLAGQFGQTKDTVLDMVKVLAMLQESTDLVSEGSQRAFAQIAEIVDLAADKYDNFASSLVFLGNHFPTTESRIVDFTERIIGTADALGISLPLVLAWGAAVTSSGIQAETGATAIRKAFLEMALAVTTASGGIVDNTAKIDETTQSMGDLQRQIEITTQRQQEYTDSTRESTKMADQFKLDKLNGELADQQELLQGLTELNGKVFQDGSAELQTFANTVSLAFQESNMSIDKFAQKFGILPSVLEDGKISATEFADIFKTNASGALQLFIEGLSHLDATEQIRILDELGLSAQRVGSTMQNLSQNTDLLSDALVGAQDAFEEGTALQEEFTKRTSTLKSALQILRNQFTALGISVFNVVEGDLRRFVSVIGDILDKLTKADPTTIRFAATVALVAAAVGPVLILVGGLVTALGTLVTAFAAIATPVGAAVLAIGAIGVALGAAFGPEIVAQIQTVIDKLTEIAKFVLKPVLDIPAPPPQPTQPGNGRTISDSILDRRDLQPVVIPPPDTSAFEEALARLKSVIPQPIKDAAKALTEAFGSIKAAFEDVVNFVGPLVTAFVTPLKEIAGPELIAAFQTLSDTIGSFGFTWGDVFKAIGTATAEVVVVILAAIVGLITGISAGIDSLAHTLDNIKQSFSLIFEGLIRIVAGFVALTDGIVHGNWTEAIRGFGAVLAGLWEVFNGVFALIETTIFGAVDLILSVFSGFVEGILSFAITLSDGLGMHVSQGVRDALTFFHNLRTEGTATIRDFSDEILADITLSAIEIPNAIGRMVDKAVENFISLSTQVILILDALGDKIIEFFTNLSNKLVGHSIIPDMNTAIITSFTSLAKDVLKSIGGLVSDALSKFSELSSKAKDFLSSIFAGGDAGAVLQLPTFDTAALDAVKLALDGVKLASEAALGSFSLFVQGAIAQFTVLQSTISSGLLTIQTMLSTAILNMQTQWSSGLASMVNMWMTAFAQALAGLNDFETRSLAAFTNIQTNFARAITNIITSIKLLIQQYVVLRTTIETESLKMIKAISFVIASVDGLTGAFKLLESEAIRAAAIVCKSYQDMAACAADAYADQTGSPELKIQHPFEKFEKFMKTADFAFSMDTSPVQEITSRLAGEIPGQSSVDNSRSSSVSATFGDIIGTPIDNKEDLAALMESRLRLVFGL